MNRNELIAYVLQNMPPLLTRLDFMPDGGVDMYFGDALVIVKPNTQKEMLRKYIRGIRQRMEKAA